MIVAPGAKPGKRTFLVDSAVDTAATLLDLAGVTPPESYDGVSLVPFLGEAAGEHTFDNRLISLRAGSWSGAVLGQYKFIEKSKSYSLFDLQADPNEKFNLADQKPQLIAALRRRARSEDKRLTQAYKSGLASPSTPKAP